MTSQAIIEAIANGIDSGIPELQITVSEWAEKYRFVPPERVADPSLAGKWSNDKTPYLVEIMDAVTNPHVNEIVFVSSAQTGKTEFLNNCFGYFAHADPATILYLCENEGKARAWSIECLAPLIRDTPVLAQLFGEARQRDSNNMIESKGFRGGHFALAWATSPATLSSRPRRVILADEVDAFESTKEGNPLQLAEARTKTAGVNRKVILVSTPRYEETSQIVPRYRDSTAEKYFVPCPHCEEKQVLQFRNPETGQRNLQWDEDRFETSAFYCQHCGEEITEDFKDWMLANGEWRSTNTAYAGNRRGFWLCELYSPWASWADLAQAYVAARNNKADLQVFVNTRLAETWQIEGDKLDVMDLRFRQEEYEAEVPDGVTLITAGVDVQGDRVEIEVVGWGLEYESWSLDYAVLYGDPTKENDEIWADLREYLTRQWEDRNGELHTVKAVGIDTGFQGDNVCRFIKANAGRRFFALKGSSVANKELLTKPSRNNRWGVPLYSIGVNAAKDIVAADLSKAEQGAGYCHFPDDRPASYFQQFGNEHKVRRIVQGQPIYRWEKVKDHARNEALDIRVYALAAAKILNPNWRALETRKNEKKKEKTSKNSESNYQNESEVEKSIIQPKAKRATMLTTNRRKGFIKGWR